MLQEPDFSSISSLANLTFVFAATKLCLSNYLGQASLSFVRFSLPLLFLFILLFFVLDALTSSLPPPLYASPRPPSFSFPPGLTCFVFLPPLVLTSAYLLVMISIFSYISSLTLSPFFGFVFSLSIFLSQFLSLSVSF